MKKKTATRRIVLRVGDCLKIMPALPASSIDAIVCDPPYGLKFVGKNWDHTVPGVAFWREALRVAKPGAHLLAFGGTRTFHHLASAIEDAGWEIRDCIMWVYGSGLPKSLDVSKAIDKQAGRKGKSLGWVKGIGTLSVVYGGGWEKDYEVHAPATAAARRWQGFGTALKPAWEPIIVARKPLDGTVAVNVQRHGTGGLNIDGCRVSPNGDMLGGGSAGASHAQHPGWRRPWMESKEGLRRHAERAKIRMAHAQALGRWPANLIHDGSEEVVAGFPRSDRASGPHIRHNKSRGTGRSKGYDGPHDTLGHGDSGSAARFFYCAKATKRDRDEGLEHMGGGKKAEVFGGGLSSSTRCVPGMHTPEGVANRPVHYNAHPTVKPTALMRYLCRLVTPPGGVILDPFMGSGSTGKAAMLEGFRFIGIDLDRWWVKIARCRIAAAARRGLLDLDPRRSTLALGRASVRLLASKTGQLASAAKAGGKAK